MILLGAAAAAPVPANGFDPALLKLRLETPPGEDDTQVQVDRLAVTRELWQSEQDVLAADDARARKVARTLATAHVHEWADSPTLHIVERWWSSGTTLESVAVPGPTGSDLNVSVHVGEIMRLRLASGTFDREVQYDPLGRRVWVDLYRNDMPGLPVGFAVTNSYFIDKDSSNLLFQFRHELR